ncbi:MAG: DUF420 domain-containing protein [Candidatus Dadabacteria bacterium]|nr:MAG: DUF420 domain-containing protein [Candidatus Dadabacteria bacterium]
MPDMLPLANTLLIVISGIALVTGRIAIARRNVAIHRASMLTATVFAVLFLVVYVVRWAMFGSTPYTGQGAARTIYFGLLIIHSIAAVVVIPFVLGALKYARREAFDEHRKRARIAFPIWLFVAVSGWVIYWMLYHA